MLHGINLVSAFVFNAYGPAVQHRMPAAFVKGGVVEFPVTLCDFFYVFHGSQIIYENIEFKLLIVCGKEFKAGIFFCNQKIFSCSYIFFIFLNRSVFCCCTALCVSRVMNRHGDAAVKMVIGPFLVSAVRACYNKGFFRQAGISVAGPFGIDSVRSLAYIFNDRFQGIPMGGYTQIIEKLLDGTPVLLNTDYQDYIKTHRDSFRKIIFTGPIDEYFNYRLGRLEWRTVRFETEKLDIENYQGNAVVNYTDREVPWTRIIEHKHFEFGTQPTTVISREYSTEWKPGMEPYYPVNDERNNDLYGEYRELADQEENVFFGGRLGTYKYYNMDQVIAEALKFSLQELGKLSQEK